MRRGHDGDPRAVNRRATLRVRVRARSRMMRLAAWRSPAWTVLLAMMIGLVAPIGAEAQTFQPPADSDVEYYHADAVGTVRLVTNAAGAAVERYDYTPFGTPIASSTLPSPAQPRGFAGKEYDAETGLDYFGGRYLLASASRFTTPDGPGNDQHPIDPQSWSLYSYTRNNPLKLVDEDGRLATVTGGLVGGLIGGALALYKGESVAKGALSGALAGAAAGLVIDTGGAALGVYGAAALSGATGGVVGGLSTRVLNGESTQAGDVVVDAAMGATFGVAGAALGQAASSAMAPARMPIGWTGRIGEDALQKLGGQPQASFPTDIGPRVVDMFVGGAAHESKVGYVTLTSAVKKQIAKDVLLKGSDSGVKSVTWHFFRSPATGKVGPSKPLMEALKSKGIMVEVHQ